MTVLPARAPSASVPFRLSAGWLLLVMGALYYAFARLGVSLAYHGRDASLVWPAIGVAVVGLLLAGRRAVPVFFVAALLSILASGAPPISAVVIAAGNVAGPALGVALLRRGDFRASLERSGDVLRLFLLCGIPASVVSATVGVAWLAMRGRYAPGEELTNWMVWAAGDLAGLVVTAPLLLVWSTHPFWWRRRERWLEFAMLLETAALACLIAFDLAGPRTFTYPLAYIVFPLAAWAALRFEQHGAVTLSALIITLAIWNTLQGTEPLSSPSVQRTLMHLHAFVVVVAASTLVLAAVTSERRRLMREQEETLRSEREARLEAQRAVAAREKVLAVVSHEIRNPLATALLNSSLVLDSAPPESLPEWMREALETVVLSTEQLEHVIRDLTDMTPLEAGQLSLQRSREPAEGLVQRVVQMLEPLAEAKGLRLEAELEEDLPPLLVNRERVMQVFSNVVGNAIRLTPSGGRIRIVGEREARSIRFSVLDTGPGISPELAEELSGPYWESPLRADGSQGLGIPIARAVVSAHGGGFRIRGRPEGGARVEFSLPCAAAAESVRALSP
jgi:signal transduction histidine kinase